MPCEPSGGPESVVVKHDCFVSVLLSWRPGSSCGIDNPAGPFPVILHRAGCILDRRHSIALDVSLVDNPSQSSPNHEHQDDQPPHAEAQESSPGTWDGIGLRCHSVLVGLSPFRF